VTSGPAGCAGIGDSSGRAEASERVRVIGIEVTQWSERSRQPAEVYGADGIQRASECVRFTNSAVANAKVLSKTLPTLEGASILSLARDRWNDVPRCRHHVMSRLSQRNRVLFVSGTVYVRRALQALTQADDFGVSQVSDSLFTFVPPPWLPHSFRPSLNLVLASAQALAIRRILRRLDMETRPIAYAWHPDAVDVVERLDPSLVVYHCYDEVAAFPGDDPGRIRAQEERLLKRADLVFAVSPGLCDRKRVFNPNVRLMRNGVDAVRFSAARSSGTAVPEDIASIKGPIVGCVTRVVPEFFDAGLLCEVFSQRPGWSLVVVGPVSGAQVAGGEALHDLQQLPNVHFLGSRQFERLPGYLKAMDVCLIPYRLTENKRLADPLKVYEYLAAGKPVVSVPLDLADDVRPLVRTGRDAAAWVTAIDEALGERRPDLEDARQAVAFANTWDERVSRISTHILDALEHRHG
jgi:glycosyltransferase involved in cell wall biosynthesis